MGHPVGKKDKELAWWHMMDAGSLNEAAEAPEEGRPGAHGSSFVPQYKLAGQSGLAGV